MKNYLIYPVKSAIGRPPEAEFNRVRTEMTEEFELKAVGRTDLKAANLRAEGKIPANIYGSDFKNQNITVDNLAFNKIFAEAGESSLVNLAIENSEPVKVLVHEVQLNPVTMKVIHIDFYKVNMKEKIKTAIPIKEVGESSAVVDLEGTLVTNRDEVEVECLPADLIPEIEVNLSVLKTFDDVVKVADLKVPEGIEILDDPEEVVFLVQPPRSEKELAELEEKPEEDVEAVEVEGEELEEDEGVVEGGEESKAIPAEGAGEEAKPAELPMSEK